MTFKGECTVKHGSREFQVHVWQIEHVEDPRFPGSKSDAMGYETAHAGKYVAVLYEDGLTSDRYQNWIAPHASLHDTVEAALKEGEQAVRRGLDQEADSSSRIPAE